MNKREALLQYLEAGRVDNYVPAAFFLHFGDDYNGGQAAIDRHREFFEFTDMDFVKIQFELPFPHVDVPTAFDFEDFPCLPIDFYRPQLEVVKGLVEALSSEAVVILTLYSPFMITGQMVGEDKLTDHLQHAPDHVFKGIEAVTDSLVDFVRECANLGLDGFYHSTQGAERLRFHDRSIFERWIKPTDHRIMNEIDELFPFNVLHICDYHHVYGGYDDLSPFLDYPGTIVNVSTRIGGLTLSPTALAEYFERPYMGGLDRLGTLSTGTESQVQELVRSVLKDAPPKFILGAECTVPATTPWENLRSAIEVAHNPLSF